MKQPKSKKDTPVTKNAERDLGLDLVRALAAFFVLSVHFLWNGGYYYQTAVQGGPMLAMSVTRMGFLTCVPLFLILTGYLCKDKQILAQGGYGRYGLGLWRVCLTYVLTSCACIALNVYRGENTGVWEKVKSVLGFSANSYAWYIEMYIGLFLLIPFLNAMWRGLENKRHRQALIVALGVMTCATTVANSRFQILPDWWAGVYPLLYYFLGAYFREYQLKPDWRWGVPAFAGSVILGGVWLYWHFRGEVFRLIPIFDWCGPTVVLSACLLFLLVRQVRVDRAPAWVRWLVRKGSELSLGIYLLSWCFDQMFYPMLAQRVPEPVDRIGWYFVIVPGVYLCSAVGAQVVDWVRRGLTWCVNRAFPKAKLK